MKFLIFAMVFSILPQAQASWQDSVKGALRPYVEKYLGDETANKLFGQKILVPMPPIPEISEAPSSVKVYQKAKDPNVPKGKRKGDVEKFDAQFILEVFEVTRGSRPKNHEVAKWLNVLSQGGTREGVYRALVLDSTYGSMEGMDFPLNNSTLDYALDFSKKYLGQNLQREELEKSNFYTLKRIFVERAMDILDAYLLENRQHFFDWYGVVSSDLSKRFSALWKVKRRKKTDPLFHQQWAKKAPEQHVKSEVAIKIHKAFNQLN